MFLYDVQNLKKMRLEFMTSSSSIHIAHSVNRSDYSGGQKMKGIASNWASHVDLSHVGF